MGRNPWGEHLNVHGSNLDRARHSSYAEILILLHLSSMVQTVSKQLFRILSQSNIESVSHPLQPCCNGPEGTNVSQQSNHTHPTQGSGQAYETHDSQVAAVHLLPGFSTATRLIDHIPSKKRWARTVYQKC